MRKITTIFLLFLSVGMYAQSVDAYVVGTIGGEFTNANVNVNFTAGESVIQTASVPQAIITQGFHQVPSVASGMETLTIDQELHVYPNPARDQLNVSLSDVANQQTVIEIYAINGQLLYREEVNTTWKGQSMQVDVSNLNPGHYQIRLVTENGAVQHARFVKS